MIKKCAEAVSDWLINSGVIAENERELYSYASYSLFLSLSPLLLAFFFGFWMGEIEKSIVLVLPFVFIRKFCGGYHAKNEWSCLLESSLLLYLCIYISSKISYDFYLAFLTLVSMVSIIIWSPIDSENRKLEDIEKKKYKSVTVLLTGLFGILIIIFFLLGKQDTAICISIGIILTAGLQIPCVLKKLFKSVVHT